MNLASVDLNLLVVFEALYQTRNVTAAGRRLNRAQPSVSNALARLRILLNDPLFVRSGGGMNLYLAYLRDPSGNKLCALHRM